RATTAWGDRRGLGSAIGIEFITRAPHRKEVLGFAVVLLEASTEAHDEIIHRPRVVVVAKLPDLFEQFLTAENEAGVLGEISKEIELELGEFDGLPVDFDLVRLEVHARIPKLENVSRLLRSTMVPLAPPEHRAHAREQLGKLEGFYHIIVCARLQSKDAILRRISRRQH